MKIGRFDEYHKYGCDFYGKLVVVDYIENFKNSTKRGFKFDIEARKLVEEKYGSNFEVLLSIPDFVVRLK